MVIPLYLLPRPREMAGVFFCLLESRALLICQRQADATFALVDPKVKHAAGFLILDPSTTLGDAPDYIRITGPTNRPKDGQPRPDELVVPDVLIQPVREVDFGPRHGKSIGERKANM